MLNKAFFLPPQYWNGLFQDAVKTEQIYLE